MKRWVCIGAIVLLLAGCTASGPDTPQNDTDWGALAETDDSVYRIYLSDKTVLLYDRDGNPVEEEEEDGNVNTLRDIQTGEPQCRVRTKTVDTGERDEWGYATVQILHALYDLEDNLIRDYEEVNYYSGVGDFILRQNGTGAMMDGFPPQGFFAALWNYKTNEEHLADVSMITSFEDGDIMLTDGWRYLLGVMNREGEIISWTEEPVYYIPTISGSYIVAGIVEKVGYEEGWYALETVEGVLLNKDLEVLLSRDRLYGDFSGIYGEHLVSEEDGRQWIINLAGDRLLEHSYPEVSYFDGRRMAVSGKLQDDQGHVLAEGFSTLTGAFDPYTEGPSGCFMGVREGHVLLLDYDGDVIKDLDVQARDIYAQGDGWFTYYTEDYVGLLDADFNIVVPADQYGYFYFLDGYPFVVGNREGVSDIMDLSGNPVIERINSVGQVGPGRFVVVKGFEAGLMDWEGHWIVKESIFQDLVDD